MIVLNLICLSGHRFEAWFAHSDAFGSQAEKGLVSCPVCGSTKIERLPSGPAILRRAAVPQPSREVVSADQVLRLLRELAQDAEDVGGDFAEEARRIHFDEVPARAIRGTATLADAADLLDEGIAVLPLPLPPKNETH